MALVSGIKLAFGLFLIRYTSRMTEKIHAERLMEDMNGKLNSWTAGGEYLRLLTWQHDLSFLPSFLPFSIFTDSLSSLAFRRQIELPHFSRTDWASPICTDRLSYTINAGSRKSIRHAGTYWYRPRWSSIEVASSPEDFANEYWNGRKNSCSGSKTRHLKAEAH